MELRALLGLRGKTAAMMCVLLVVTIAAVMQRNLESAHNPVLVAASYGAMGICAVLVVYVPSDPLNFGCTLLIVAVGPATTYLTLRDAVASSIDDYAPSASFAYSLVLCALIIRGRPRMAWVAVGLCAVAFAAVALTEASMPTSIAAALAIVGTVAAVNVFMVIIRPTMESLFALREDATMRAAAEATMVAQNEERDRQLDRLDAVARPMLEKIAGGVLSSSERERCRLLEAELRDGLRAAQLATRALAAAARGARSRGVEVVLLDDGGFAEVRSDVRATVLECAEDALNSSDSGSVTVRVLPKGKRYLASVLVNDASGDRRTEIATDGTVTTTVEYADQRP
ncbi:hypothetical protein [Antrihabitans sp. YC2-6]|uniref:hypothetical protein n=1 Tax=Antrihabitans sp. YC2-6 TaxID=2799498 RepID=UPI0018F61A4F|nr:hypothetical protein [Antrihabitans sp. YC2-6]MBJ8344986.1 hypothetical protein [Antrihabitans sp. YC2-6]